MEAGTADTEAGTAGTEAGMAGTAGTEARADTEAGTEDTAEGKEARAGRAYGKARRRGPVSDANTPDRTGLDPNSFHTVAAVLPAAAMRILCSHRHRFYIRA